MSTPIMILGESGTGKTYSLRNLDPAQTLLIEATRKNLPFKTKDSGWADWDKEKKTGNIFYTDNSTDICILMQNTKKKIVVIDDFQYILANELMRRYRETGYGKFSEAGYNGWNIFQTASSVPDKHIYILGHTMMGEDGITKIKTAGKLLENYSMEGMCSMVLRTFVQEKRHYFSTQNNGSDTVKSPPGMFDGHYVGDSDLIENDLKMVDDCVTAFGW